MSAGLKARALALLATAFMPVACNGEDIESESLVGLRKAQVESSLGPPDAVEELVKDQEHIRGPVETLWYELEPGGRIVIWKYETDTGTKELYFLNDTDEVAGEFFRHSDSSKNPVF